MIYDISRTITPKTAVWEGDTPYSFHHNLEMQRGASINLTTITLSPHTGTHADAYYHYTSDGEHPASMALAPYIGQARVITVELQNGALLPEHLGERAIGAERILIHSHVSELDDSVFPKAFPYLSVSLIDQLAEQGVKLIGLDSPSVDALDSTALPCHNALRRHNMANLEVLQLSRVPDGDYWLTALPLKLDGVCGSPVRAILQTID